MTPVSARVAMTATSKWAVLAVAGVSAFMTTLDASIVNIGLPSIARAFGTPLNGTIEWVVIGYLVVIVAVLLTAGRVADLIGRKPVFLAGLATFTAGSAACGAAPSLDLLIAARAFQGLGAALIFAVNVAMVAGAFPAEERGRALGINAILVALGVSAGPTLGGVITQFSSWRWIFYVNVPLGLVTWLVAWTVLHEPAPRRAGRFDPAGALLLALGFAALTLGLSFGQEWGWTSLRVVAAIVGGAATLGIAGAVERRRTDPIVDLVLFRDRVFASANASFVLCMLALFAVGFLMPFYFEELRGFDVERSGLLLAPLALAIAIVAPLSGTLSDRIGSRWLAPAGLALAAGGLALLSTIDANTPPFAIAWRLVIIGVGQGIFQSPNTRALMGAAPADKQGIASGLLSTGRVIGQALSVAVSGAVFAGLGGMTAGSGLVALRGGVAPATLDILQGAFLRGFHAALLTSAVLAFAGALVALVRHDPARAPAPRPAPGRPGVVPVRRVFDCASPRVNVAVVRSGRT